MSIEHATVASPRLDVRIRNLRGVLYVGNDRSSLELTDVAAFLWRLLDGQRSVSDLGRRLSAEYEIDLDIALADTAALIATLVEADLVRCVR